MVVGCPKCKTKLKIADERIKPEGTKFKCPKCATLLLIKPPTRPAAPAAPAAPPRPAAAAPKPAAAPQRPAAPAAAAKPGVPEGKQAIEAQAKEINRKKILVAHEKPAIVEKIMSKLLGEGYLILPCANGVDAQVQAMKELPFLVILDAALPKTSGFEVVKRMKEQPTTKGIKAVILSSKSDMSRKRMYPADMYGVSEYLDDDEIDTALNSAMAVVLGMKAPSAPPQAAAPRPAAPQPAAAPRPAAAPAAPAAAAKPAAKPGFGAPATGADAMIEKAKRLARTVLSDIDLYSPDKVLESIRSGQFQTVFAEELREGLKHYQNRIPQEVRSKGNFFQVAIDEFIEKKKKIMGLA